MRNMNILYLTPRLPLPADTGAKIRTFNLLKAVARSHAVTLLSFYFEEASNSLEELKRLGIQVHLVKIKERINPFSLLSPAPASILKYAKNQMRQTIARLIFRQPFDIVHCDHLHIGQYRDSFNGIPCILDEHNVESVILQRCSEIEKNSFRQWLFKSQAKKMARFEANLAQKFSMCLTVSETDRQSLLKLTKGNVNAEVIPNGVDMAYFDLRAMSSGLKEEDSLVFTGSMNWLPNYDAVLYFCNEILPRIWKEYAQVKFYIVGKNPCAEIRRLAENDRRIVVTGLVEDVRPFIAAAGVFVAPIRIAGGTRLKILEAMAMEKAVVSTIIGAEGIKCTDSKDIFLADTAEDFALKVCLLLKEKGKAKIMGEAARRLVSVNYDWINIASRLNQLYQEIRYASAKPR